MELEVISNITVLFSKSEGRDKVGRFVQYFARALVGFVELSGPSTDLKRLGELATNVMKQLASARRTHRWCKEFPVLQAIPKSLQIANPVDCFLETASKVALSTFLIIDHVAWLKQVQILKGKQNGTGTIQLGLKFFAWSNIFSFLLQLKKFNEASTGEKDKEKKGQAAKAAFKHALVTVQCLHLSTVYVTHNSLVGILGMITSYMDFSAQWPQKKRQSQ